MATDITPPAPEPIEPAEPNEPTEPIAQEESASLRRLLARAGRTYDLVIARALEAAEMDDLPMRGISILRRIGHDEEGTPLATVLRSGRISRQHGTQLIDTLVERGYIVRETDPEDRRRMRVALTERGVAAAEAVRIALDSLNSTLAAQVSAEHLEATRTVLAALIDLAPEGADAEAGWGPDRGCDPRGHDPRGFGGRRGPDPRVHGPGRGHGRGPGRGPRGPMRDFAGMPDPREGFRARMQAFAAGHAAFSDEDEASGHPRRGRDHDHDHHFGHREHAPHRGPVPMVHIDTMIVNADRGRGRGRHRRRQPSTDQ